MVYTFGFDEKFVLRSLMRHSRGILESRPHSDRSKIMLFTVDPVIDKVKSAYNIVRDFVEKYFGEDKADIELIPLKIEDFEGLVSEIKLKITSEITKHSTVVINLTGGMRVLVLATYTALLFIPRSLFNGRNLIIEVEREDGNSLINIPPEIILVSRLIDRITNEKLRIIKALLERGEADAQSLSEIFKLDVSTVRRHLDSLEELGLVEITRGKPMRARAKHICKLLI